jgi:hypothetical protein
MKGTKKIQEMIQKRLTAITGTDIKFNIGGAGRFAGFYSIEDNNICVRPSESWGTVIHEIAHAVQYIREEATGCNDMSAGFCEKNGELISRHYRMMNEVENLFRISFPECEEAWHRGQDAGRYIHGKATCLNPQREYPLKGQQRSW